MLKLARLVVILCLVILAMVYAKKPVAEPLAIDAHPVSNVTVTWTGGSNCTLEFLHRKMPCALGKNGATVNKKEGDGKTPLGTFSLRRAFSRIDRSTSSNWCYQTSPYLHCEAIRPDFAWVDEPSDPMYNRFVHLPYPQNSTTDNATVSYEHLFLPNSPVYDLFAVIGYNDNPVIPYQGSAIFFHIASDNYGPTAGCVSLKKNDLIFVLSQLQRESLFIIQEGPV